MKTFAVNVTFIVDAPHAKDAELIVARALELGALANEEYETFQIVSTHVEATEEETGP